MPFPSFADRFPALDVPFPETVVSTHALRSDAGLMVMFDFHRDVDLPAHSHGAQWGTVIRGSVELTIDGETRIYHPGDTYEIAAGVVHAVRVPAGSQAIDIFAEADRYPLKD